MRIHGVGIDVVDVSRVARLLDTSGDRFVRRWFSPEEIAQCQGQPDPERAFAARLAAKEAVWKALRLDGWAGTVPWRLVTIVRGSSADPVTVELATEVASVAVGLNSIHVDWFAAADVAVAVAVAIAESGGAGETGADASREPDSRAQSAGYKTLYATPHDEGSRIRPVCRAVDSLKKSSD